MGRKMSIEKSGGYDDGFRRVKVTLYMINTSIRVPDLTSGVQSCQSTRWVSLRITSGND